MSFIMLILNNINFQIWCLTVMLFFNLEKWNIVLKHCNHCNPWWIWPNVLSRCEDVKKMWNTWTSELHYNVSQHLVYNNIRDYSVLFLQFTCEHFRIIRQTVYRTLDFLRSNSAIYTAGDGLEFWISRHLLALEWNRFKNRSVN